MGRGSRRDRGFLRRHAGPAEAGAGTPGINALRKGPAFPPVPEPKDFALGLSMGHPDGSGIGPHLAREMCEGLEFFAEHGRGSDDRLLAMMVGSYRPRRGPNQRHGVQHPEAPVHRLHPRNLPEPGDPVEQVAVANSGDNGPQTQLN
jgi:hypothetical protein